MSEQIKKNEENIINNISLLKSNKNPFSVLFILADLKDIFISIGETLLNGIETHYSDESKRQYLQILNAYKESGIFESIYNYYFNNDGLRKFKKEIDEYVKHSFFFDISFFYFTVSRNDMFKIIFDMLEVFYTDSNIKNNFFSYDTYLEKKQYLESLSTDFSSLQFEKEIYFVIKFLNHFSQFDFHEITIHFNNTIPSNVKIMKEITLIIFSDSARYPELQELFLSTFINNDKIYDSILEKLEENKLFEVISFLNRDLISAINYSFPLDYDSKTYIAHMLGLSKSFHLFTVDDKIKFLLMKENNFVALGSEKGDFSRISFKRQLLELKFPDIIDITMGINYLPADVFYLLKQKNQTLDLHELAIYNEVKDLILYIEKSYFLGLIRPFLLRNISEFFNISDQKYYVIKFILSVVLTSSYSEYKSVSKFFYNLESFYKKDFLSFVSRIMQFGWIILLTFFLSFFAPFGVLLAFMLLLLKHVIDITILKYHPKLKMSLNFQIGTFAGILCFLSLVFGGTIGYNENVKIVYEKFHYVINSISLPGSESLKAIYGESSLLKADIMGSQRDQ